MFKYYVIFFLLLTNASLFSLTACDSQVGGIGISDGDISGSCICEFGCHPDGSCKGEICEDDLDCPPGEMCLDGECVIINKDGDAPDGDSVDGDGPNIVNDGDFASDGDLDRPDSPTDGDMDEEYGIDFETDIPHDPSNPWIFVDPLRIDFGAVPQGTVETRGVMVANWGHETLVIDKVYLYHDSPELRVRDLALPISLEFEEEKVIEVLYEPEDIEVDSDLLVIHSNDPSEPNVGVEVTTEVKAVAILAVDPMRIDFGIVRVGHHIRQLNIINEGGLELYLQEITLSTSDEFSLQGLPAELLLGDPYALLPFSTLSLEVHYSPTIGDGEEDTGLVSILSNYESNPRVDVEISGIPCEPEIEVFPTILSYPDVAYGQSGTKCTTISNSGCFDLNISEISMTDSGDGAYNFSFVPGLPFTLGPDEEDEVCVRFSPSLSGDNEGAFEIHNDDMDEEVVEVMLTTSFAPPDIDCQPRPLNFGAVDITGPPASEIITCRNTGPGELNISQFLLVGSGGVFSIANNPDTVLNTGDSTDIEIEYAPTVEGDDTSQLQIHSNDPDENPYNITIFGSAYWSNRCPIALISILDPPIDDIHQYDTVQLDGTGSSDPDPGDSVAEYAWSLEIRPAGSFAHLSSTTAPQPKLEIDKPGLYQIKLEVIDDNDITSCEPAFVEFTAKDAEPDIDCSPTLLDFGDVGVGQTHTMGLICRNNGFGELLINQFEITDTPTGNFTLNNSPDTSLGYSESNYIEILYTPTDVAGASGSLKIHSNDPDENPVVIELGGGSFTPNICPVADITITSPNINNIIQNDTVHFDGSGSYDPDPGDSIFQYIWTIETHPPGSTSTIRPWGSPTPSLYVDESGDYRIKLQVKDSFNLVSCAPAYVDFTVKPPDPDIVCSPMVLNYGTVAIGDTLTLSTTCTNMGHGPLAISQYQVISAGNVFTLANSPASLLNYMDSTSVHVRYAPTSSSNITGTLRIHSNDPDQGLLDISLIGNSYDPNNCPVAQFSTNPNVNTETIRPLDTIQFDARSSYDPDAGDSIAEYIWTIVQRPNGSTSQMQGGASPTPSLFIDLAGHYRIRLEVRDNHGLLNCSHAQVDFDAIPGERIHIQLVWNTNEGDQDLHLVRPGGSFWDTSTDCFYQRMSPNWGGYGRPSLDIDDQHGYGPENINLDDPGNGDYEVYVHYYNSWGEHDTANVTVRVYIWGTLADEFTVSWPESSEHYRWHAATIRWSGNTGTVIGRGYNLVYDGHGQRRGGAATKK